MRSQGLGLTLGALALACGGADGPPTTTTLPRAVGPGVHDHTPQHGGMVGMAGELHLEAVLREGRIRLYLSDFWRRPLPVADVTGAVTLELPEGDQRLALAAGAAALEADTPPLAVPEVAAHVELSVGGRPAEMDFLLPVEATRPGAAGLPLGGCLPVPEAQAGGARRPRCRLELGRAVTALVATPDARTLLVAGVDLGVSAWRLPAGELSHGFAPPPPLAVARREHVAPHPEAASAIAVAPSGAEAVVALEARLLRYDIASGRVLHELAAARATLRALAWSPRGADLLVTTFYDPAAHLLAAADGAEVRALPVSGEAAVAFAPDGQLAAVGDERGDIALFPLGEATPPRVLRHGHGAVQALAFARRRLVSAGDDGTLRVWDLESGRLAGEALTGRALARLAAAPDGRLVASAGIEGVVRLHDVSDGRVVETLGWHAQQVLGLAWAGGVLASGDTRGRVVLWDVGDLLVSSRRPPGGSGPAR